MWPDRVSNPGPPTYESGALPTALRGPAIVDRIWLTMHILCHTKNRKYREYIFKKNEWLRSTDY